MEKSTTVLSTGREMEEIMPKLAEFVLAVENAFDGMSVSTMIPHHQDGQSISSLRSSMIASMKEVMSNLDLPDLLQFMRSDPKILAQDLMTIFDNEITHLNTLIENQNKKFRDTKDEIKNQTAKIEMIERIREGLNNKKKVDVETLIEEINDLKLLNKQLKADFDTICNRCCPELKDDLKRIFTALEHSQNCSDKEEEHWVDLETLECPLETIKLLLLSDIVELDDEGRRIKFISIEF